MQIPVSIHDKIFLERKSLLDEIERRRGLGQHVVFTNGCFDIIHVGHTRYLSQARARGDCLVVAINSDDSALRLKGPGHPILPSGQRARILAALEDVDLVTVFDEDDPIPLLKSLRPDTLLKGGDYGVEGVVGREVVEEYGGRVEVMSQTDGLSTSKMIQHIIDIHEKSA